MSQNQNQNISMFAILLSCSIFFANIVFADSLSDTLKYPVSEENICPPEIPVGTIVPATRTNMSNATNNCWASISTIHPFYLHGATKDDVDFLVHDAQIKPYLRNEDFTADYVSYPNAGKYMINTPVNDQYNVFRTLKIVSDNNLHDALGFEYVDPENPYLFMPGVFTKNYDDKIDQTRSTYTYTFKDFNNPVHRAWQKQGVEYLWDINYTHSSDARLNNAIHANLYEPSNFNPVINDFNVDNGDEIIQQTSFVKNLQQYYRDFATGSIVEKPTYKITRRNFRSPMRAGLQGWKINLDQDITQDFISHNAYFMFNIDLRHNDQRWKTDYFYTNHGDISTNFFTHANVTAKKVIEFVYQGGSVNAEDWFEKFTQYDYHETMESPQRTFVGRRPTEKLLNINDVIKTHARMSVTNFYDRENANFSYAPVSGSRRFTHRFENFVNDGVIFGYSTKTRRNYYYLDEKRILEKTFWDYNDNIRMHKNRLSDITSKLLKTTQNLDIPHYNVLFYIKIK